MALAQSLSSPSTCARESVHTKTSATLDTPELDAPFTRVSTTISSNFGQHCQAKLIPQDASPATGIAEAATERASMDHVLKARDLGSASARRKRIQERESARRALEALQTQRRQELLYGYESDEEDLSDSGHSREEQTYSPIHDEEDEDEDEIRNKAAPHSGEGFQRMSERPNVSMFRDSNNAHLPEPLSTSDATRETPLLLKQSTSVKLLCENGDEGSDSTLSTPPSPSRPTYMEPTILIPSDAPDLEALLYHQDFSPTDLNQPLSSPWEPETPLETATPIAYLLPPTKPSLISVRHAIPRLTTKTNAARPPSRSSKWGMKAKNRISNVSGFLASEATSFEIPSTSPADMNPTPIYDSESHLFSFPFPPIADPGPPTPEHDETIAIHRSKSGLDFRRRASSIRPSSRHTSKLSPDDDDCRPRTSAGASRISQFASLSSASFLGRDMGASSSSSGDMEALPPLPQQGRPRTATVTSVSTVGSNATGKSGVEGAQRKKSFSALRSGSVTVSKAMKDGAKEFRQKVHVKTTVPSSSSGASTPTVGTNDGTFGHAQLLRIVGSDRLAEASKQASDSHTSGGLKRMGTKVGGTMRRKFARDRQVETDVKA